MGPIDLIVKFFAKRYPPRGPEVPAAPARPVVPEVPAAEPAPPRVYWLGGMIPRAVGPGERIERSGGGGFKASPSVRLEWVSRETDAGGVPLRVRTPESRTVTMPASGFTAAGKRYKDLGQLVRRRENGGSWATDAYGRNVLALAERFPCFDSSDYLYEDRYFRWFFLCLDGKLTCVYHTDGADTVTVTEDVLDLEKECWAEMNKLECFG